MKRAKNGQWIHIVCALYNPFVRFGDHNKMTAITIPKLVELEQNVCL